LQEAMQRWPTRPEWKPRSRAHLAALVGSLLGAASACSPLQLDLTVGDASLSPDSGDATARDAVGSDATVVDSSASDAVTSLDAQDASADAGAADTSPSVDANDAGPQPMPCAQGSDCTGATTPYCNTDAGFCVQCLSSGDCGGNTPHCNAAGVCIACGSNADCNDGGAGARLCNTYIPRCTSACTTGRDCAQQPSQQPCDQTDGWCVECTNGTYCMGNATGTYCYPPPVGVCGCQSDLDCRASTTNRTCGPPSPTGLRFCQ
jgi:hypothetical protein